MTAIMTDTAKDTSRHPCFNREAAGSCGRVHLPVAPRCNIKCNYCNRKYDCVNESRPGVASAVLAPAQALAYMERVLAGEPRISVVGIAGPGDPFANPAETLETLRLIKGRYPQLLFCLSSNGLNLPPYLDDLAELGVTHVTVTVNAVDPAIGEKIYAFVRDGNVVFQGRQAAELLLSRQLEAIKGLKARGITVKVNSICIPGINEQHLPEVARTVAALGADIQNIIPLHPTAETAFASLPEPSHAQIHALRAEIGTVIPQMTHCKRCRADAVGLLCNDRSGEFAPTLQACAGLKGLGHERPYVAVATREGVLVNLHLGEATSFQVWGQADGGFRLLEERPAPRSGGGPKRWENLAHTLKDCRMVLASAMGDTPRQLLGEYGLTAYPVSGFIEDALRLAYGSGGLERLAPRRKGIAGGCCSGSGGGCG